MNIKSKSTLEKLKLNLVQGGALKEYIELLEQEAFYEAHEVMEEAERHTIINYLEVMNGNKSETAKALGISRTTLYEKMKKYGL